MTIYPDPTHLCSAGPVSVEVKYETTSFENWNVAIPVCHLITPVANLLLPSY